MSLLLFVKDLMFLMEGLGNAHIYIYVCVCVFYMYI